MAHHPARSNQVRNYSDYRLGRRKWHTGYALMFHFSSVMFYVTYSFISIL